MGRYTEREQEHLDRMADQAQQLADQVRGLKSVLPDTAPGCCIAVAEDAHRLVESIEDFSDLVEENNEDDELDDEE